MYSVSSWTMTCYSYCGKNKALTYTKEARASFKDDRIQPAVAIKPDPVAGIEATAHSNT